MSAYKYLFLITFLVLFTGTSKLLSKDQEGVRVYEFYLNDAHYNEYQDFLNGRDPLDIDFSKETNVYRMILEPFIFQIAPVLGGCNCEIKYKKYGLVTPHQRSIIEVADGRTISHPIAGFGGDTRLNIEKIALTEPILDAKDFYVGLYTWEKRADILSITNISDIKNLNFAVVDLWEIDKQVIDGYNFFKVTADDWQSMLNMIEAGYADVVMQPFQATENLEMIDLKSDRVFLPIPNVKIAFNQPRQYFVSTTHPDGAEFLKAINKGILELKSKGLLKTWHETAGIINERTEDFQVYE